ncbi:MAG TPA: lipid-binding SYLF domain-containing protein [Verrucomicrobiae bacterium]|jgi:lipid-binding SYLF domain-containing protein|nr:lipid-binding SYLF domain-containing protein [Verrucomicrobiae bacterium]
MAETERERIEVEREVNAIREERRKEVAEIHQKDSDRLRESRAILRELLSGKAHISNSLLRQAKCVIVIPSVKKLASGFGMKYGRGVMTCRLGEEFQGTWSAPSMYALEGGNFGFQIGLQATDLVLLVMNDRGVDSLLGSKVKLGGDMSVAAGPMGRAMEVSTDLAMRAKLLAYSRTHGIFVGVALDGSTVRPDNHANEVLYGRDITAREIVRSGTVAVPRDARPLLELLEESVHVASEGAPPQGHVQQH